MRRISITLSMLMMLIGAGLAAQTINTDIPDAQLTAAEQRLDSLTVVRTDLVRQADLLSGRIAAYERKSSLSQTEHGELQEHLRNAQRLQDRVNRIDGQIRNYRQSYQTNLGILVQTLQREIHQILLRMETGESDSELKSQLQILMDRKTSWSAKIIPNLETVPAYAVEARDNDSPRRLRIKGDMLSDQEDAVRRDLETVENRIESLREEVSVRQKVSELASEMDLFNEREELLGRSVGTALSTLDEYTVRENQFTDLTWGGNRGAYGGTLGSTAFPEITRAMSESAPRSAEAIQEWIDQLMQYRNGLAAHADSLGNQALWFYRKAEGKPE